MLTLDDLKNMPGDPDELQLHLLNRGLIAPPTPPPAAPPLVPPGPVNAPLSPVTPHAESATSGVKPMSPLGKELAIGATSQPTVPKATPADVTAPTIGGMAPPTDLGIKPMAPLSPPPEVGSAAYTASELKNLEDKKAEDTLASHPTALGKIGHVAGRIGNIAGNIVVPNVMAGIPGTELNTRIKEAGLKNELATRTTAEEQEKNRESEEKLRGVQEEEVQNRLEKEKTEQTLEKDAEGNITGWKDGKGVLHSLDEPETPQAIRDIAGATSEKPHFEHIGDDIVQVTPGKNGEPSKSDVVYKGDPKIKPEVRSIVSSEDGHAHDYIIDMTPNSPNFGAKLKDLGRAKEDKQPSAAQDLARMIHMEDPVVGYDSTGQPRLVPRSQAEQEGFTHVMKASSGDREKATTHTEVLNDMQKKLNDIVDSSGALDQGKAQRIIISSALSHAEHGMWNDLVRTQVMKGATQQTKDYVQSVLSLRESALGLPKELTGGSRVQEIQASALWATLPDAGSLDKKYAIEQSQKFQDNIDRLRKRVPLVEGVEHEKTHLTGGTTGGGATVKFGGQNLAINPDGTVDIPGKGKYKVTPGSKELTKVKTP